MHADVKDKLDSTDGQRKALISESQSLKADLAQLSEAKHALEQQLATGTGKAAQLQAEQAQSRQRCSDLESQLVLTQQIILY